jgi:hypothetical protein
VASERYTVNITKENTASGWLGLVLRVKLKLKSFRFCRFKTVKNILILTN